MTTDAIIPSVSLAVASVLAYATVAMVKARWNNGKAVSPAQCQQMREDMSKVIELQVKRLEQRIDGLRELTEAGFETLRAELGASRRRR